MIARKITTSDIFNLNTEVNKTINTSGFKSAKVIIDVNVVSGNYGNAVFQVNDENGNNLQLLSKDFGNKSSIIADSNMGSHKEEYFIDLSKTQSINVITTKLNYFINSGIVKIYYSYDAINVDDFKANKLLFRRENSNLIKEIPVTDKLALINIEFPKTPSLFTIYIRGKIKGASDFTNLVYYNNETGVKNGSGFIQTTENAELWANVENYEALQYEIVGSFSDLSYVGIKTKFSNSLNRKINLILNSTMNDIGNFRFAKVSFQDYHFSIKRYQISFDNIENKLPIVKDMTGKILNSNQKSEFTFSDAFYFNILGEKIEGGFILDYDQKINGNIIFKTHTVDEIISGATPTQSGSVIVELSDSIEYEISQNETLFTERKDYDVIALNIDERVVDALGEDILTKVNDTTYKLYRLSLNAWSYEIPINATYIPSLLSGETINYVRLVKSSNIINQGFNRISLFTNKNRILYNHIKDGFINYFREAPIYNSEKKFHIVDTKGEASATAKYLPIFPEYNYDQFSGRTSGETPILDVFGEPLPKRVSTNGYLLEDFKKDNLFVQLAHSNLVNSKFYGAVLAPYGYTNSEPLLMASADGKEWTVIKWFATVEEYDLSQLSDMKVDLSAIISNAGGYTANSLKVTHRKYNVPTSDNKEPATPFVIGGSALITAINVSGGETTITVNNEALLMTDAKNSLMFNSLAPIVYIENVSASAEYNYITNSIDANGTGNTGILFRLKRISTNQFKLIGMVGNPYEGRAVCRHFHSVSEYQSGFVVTTGENYRERNGVEKVFEGGFIYLIPADNRNNTSSNVYTHLNIKNQYFWNEPVRLTSSENGVNRACGAYLMADKNNTLLYVSDDLTNKRNIQIAGRTVGIETTTLGVYKVGLADIDDINKIDCVAETFNPAIGLTENNGRFAISQFAGNAIFSSDFGNTWHQETLPTIQKALSYPSFYYGGMVSGILDDGSFIFGNTKIKFK